MHVRFLGILFATCGGPLIAQTASSSPAPSGPSPTPQVKIVTDEPISAQEARATALRLADVIEENYVVPETATAYARALRKRTEEGAYDAVGSTISLAQLLTADLQRVSPDRHLNVMPVGAPPAGAGPVQVFIPRPGSAPGQAPAMPPQLPEIEKAGWIAPGIAFVRFNAFSGSADVIAKAEKFMQEHANASVVIFDLRTHRGGGLGEMDAILPYLYATPTTLLTMETRASVDRRRPQFNAGERVRRVPAGDDIVRREHFVTPHPAEKRLFDAKVYLLTSAFTASAAEHFALALKRTGRATLIGEVTAGAGNYGGGGPINERFSAFIPVGMTRDPVTGARWEGNGIEPDVAVDAQHALVEALKRSGVAPAEAEKLSAAVHPSGSMKRYDP